MVCHWRLSALQTLGLTLVLAGLGLFGPSRAVASCGADYVVVTDNKNNPDHRPATIPQHSMSHHPLDGRPKAPCHGPNCSEAPKPRPLAPMPTSVQIFPDVKALFDDLLFTVIPPAPTFDVTHSAALSPIARPLAIFHPPRG